MAKSDYLLISRGVWDSTASKEEVQHAIDRFYAWYDKQVDAGVFKPGSRLENTGKVVSRKSITDGPFTETKELVGGYWFIVADSLDHAAQIASENPCIQFGLSLEIRPLASVRARAIDITNETPQSWREGRA